jgi:hypothetical protein
MHITKEEEKALGIKEYITVAWREEHNIPGTESLDSAGNDPSRRNAKKREIRLSTIFSGSHDQNGLKDMLYQSK